MEEPVILSDGHTYEKESIVRWLQEHSTSPMTNLPLANKHWIRNHALEKIIDAYENGTLSEMSDAGSSNPTAPIRPKPILISKKAAAYVVCTEFSLIYTNWDFAHVKFELCQGNVLWTHARYQYGGEYFVQVDKVGLICESHLRSIPYSTEPFVIQAMRNIAYRFIPNNNVSAKINEEAAIKSGTVVSGSLSIKAPDGVTYYYIDSLYQGFVFDRCIDGIAAFKVIECEKPTGSTPWVLEVMHTAIALRKHPDYSQELRLSTELKLLAMVASSARVVGQYGDHFYWVKVGDLTGWVFATRTGETMLHVLVKEPRRITLPPGDGLILACDEVNTCVIIISASPVAQLHNIHSIFID